MQEKKDNAKVLIVDDEKVHIDVLVGLLKPYYRTAAAKNGEQAFRRLEKPPLPDLILLDIMMPGTDGYVICRNIKKNPVIQDIPVIFISGKNEEQDEAKGFQAGAVDYITKPFSPLITLARVKNHIELKRRGDILARIAAQDGLTGIPNRRRFDQILSSEWKRSLRHQHYFSIILLDIDFFKRYNDHYGHAEGDECLKKVAKTISTAMPRSEDLAARYGGEEFACILPETGLDGALVVADRIIKNIRQQKILHEKSDADNYVTVSIGVNSRVPQPTETQINLVEAADQALYKAKKNGRNQIVTLKDGSYYYHKTI
ncbi:response regulator receiver modulated diguanylate cyclase [Candidatus Magnetomorum sp. HK-1]|nr:response regulator receiver modulated diguanylate cyclase [Candidatus Magnetomorum sp. HK-1]